MFQDLLGQEAAVSEHRHQVTQRRGGPGQTLEGRRLPLAQAHEILQASFRSRRCRQQHVEPIADGGGEALGEIGDLPHRPRRVAVSKGQQALHVEGDYAV